MFLSATFNCASTLPLAGARVHGGVQGLLVDAVDGGVHELFVEAQAAPVPDGPSGRRGPTHFW